MLPSLFNQRGILGKVPSLAHKNPRPKYPNGKWCWACSSFGHLAIDCSLPPQSSCLAAMRGAPSPSDDHRIPSSMTVGPRSFHSFGEYYTFCTSKRPPVPIVIPWCCPWAIKAPEFLDDEEEVLTAPASASSTTPSLIARIFTSFGEFAHSVLGLSPAAITTHVSWVLKPPIPSPATVHTFF